MKNVKILKVYLIISGLLLTVIGSLTSFNPVEIKAGEGIEIAGNASALNDVRAFGMLLLATAAWNMIGAFKAQLRKSAIISSFVLFLSLGLGRVLSIVLDGMPSDGMVKATGLEIILGLAGVILFFIYREKQTH